MKLFFMQIPQLEKEEVPPIFLEYQDALSDNLGSLCLIIPMQSV